MYVRSCISPPCLIPLCHLKDGSVIKIKTYFGVSSYQFSHTGTDWIRHSCTLGKCSVCFRPKGSAPHLRQGEHCQISRFQFRKHWFISWYSRTSIFMKKPKHFLRRWTVGHDWTSWPDRRAITGGTSWYSDLVFWVLMASALFFQYCLQDSWMTTNRRTAQETEKDAQSGIFYRAHAWDGCVVNLNEVLFLMCYKFRSSTTSLTRSVPWYHPVMLASYVDPGPRCHR